jgi:hypothetical protein
MWTVVLSDGTVLTVWLHLDGHNPFVRVTAPRQKALPVATSWEFARETVERAVKEHRRLRV